MPFMAGTPTGTVDVIFIFFLDLTPQTCKPGLEEGLA